MPPDLQGALVYWPAIAAAAALIVAVFAAGWCGVMLKTLRINIAAAAKNRKDLDEMRVASREQLKKVEARRAEMEKLHDTAKRLFWQVEKTWIG